MSSARRGHARGHCARAALESEAVVDPGRATSDRSCTARYVNTGRCTLGTLCARDVLQPALLSVCLSVHNTYYTFCHRRYFHFQLSVCTVINLEDSLVNYAIHAPVFQILQLFPYSLNGRCVIAPRV